MYVHTLQDDIDLIYDGIELLVHVRYHCFIFETDATGLSVGLLTHFMTLFKQISETLPNKDKSEKESHDSATISFSSLFECSDGFVYHTADATSEDKSVQAVSLYPASGKGTVVHFQNYLAIAEALESYNNI